MPVISVRTGSGKDGPVLSESGGVLADLEIPDGRADLSRTRRAAPGRAGGTRHRVLHA